ncbi:two-component regulator propeller domain-containing protein, partial [Clostridium celatum]|uniref:two-component regulator propeller domain-containing protein n=1 Tax=Clostridium celatum TaxID=36834 RepID=UPI002914FE72
DRKDKYNLGELSITSLIKSKYDENIMWVGTENGLMKIDVRNNSIQTFYHDPSDLNSLTNSSITCLEEGEDILWVGTKQGLNIIDKDLKVSSNRSDSSTDKLFISNMTMDENGNLWISTKEGIFIYNIKEERRDYIYN